MTDTVSTGNEDLRIADDGEGMVRSGGVHFHRDLLPLMRDIDDATPAPFNYNHGDVETIQESIEVNGVYRPIYVQRSSGHIIAGNHTWMAMKSLDSHVAPIVYLDADDAEARRIMVTDNESAKKANPDNSMLLVLLQEIEQRSDKPATVGTSITETELEHLRKLDEIDPDEGNEFSQWPMFSVRLPPHVLRGFMAMTDEAGDDRERFELLLRLAGWEG